MDVEVGGTPAFVHTGGLEFGAAQPVVVLIHGAGQDHSIFRLHTRRLAHGGVSPLAVDLPGHGRSAGSGLGSVAEYAAWVVDLLDALGVDRAFIVGHSMGSLIAIELAAAYSDRVAGIVLTGTADAMGVHPDLQEAASGGRQLAVELISGWSHTGEDRLGGHPQPGSWTRGITERLAEQELASTLGSDLAACSGYPASERATSIACPAFVVVGTADVMTAAGAGRSLAGWIPGAEVVEVVGTGHNIVLDRPVELGVVIDRLVGR
jgi:pimeloyl-ACP methyl ester carboxylesterase